MNIGVRFCGGCRSLFDRGAALDAVKDACPGFSFDYFTENEKYDIILVINGCFTACAETPGALEGAKRMSLGPEEADDIPSFARRLREAAEETEDRITTETEGETA